MREADFMSYVREFLTPSYDEEGDDPDSFARSNFATTPEFTTDVRTSFHKDELLLLLKKSSCIVVRNRGQPVDVKA